MLQKLVNTLEKDRYLLEGEDREAWFRRVANYIGKEDSNNLYQLLTSGHFMFNTPAMRNAGRPNAQLAACFKIPVDDQLFSVNQWENPESVGIFASAAVMAKIFQSGGGVGINFSSLRPEGSPVGSGGTSSGPVSFMEVFNVVTQVTKQGGARRGAMMGLLDARHPDILKFITSKMDHEKLNGMNLSVVMDDKFMEAVEDGEAAHLAIWHNIVEQAWQNGEPGLFFVDTVNRHNPHLEEYGPIDGCNPCGEIPIYDWESCVLGSINLGALITSDGIETDALWCVVRDAVKYLNAIIDLNQYPLPIIETMTKRTRKIGLGIMGWADVLAKLRIPYDSKRAYQLAESIMGLITQYAHELSQGRNSVCTAIAPTGSISLLTGCSASIEPYYALVYDRFYDGQYYEIVEPIFEFFVWQKYGEENLPQGYETMMHDCLQVVKHNHGSIQGLDDWFSNEEQQIWKIAREISPEAHLKMALAFQKFTDQSVSKTINMPSEATKEDVANILMAAWKGGSKGITVYRDLSRPQQTLSTSNCPVGGCT